MHRANTLYMHLYSFSRSNRAGFRFVLLLGQANYILCTIYDVIPIEVRRDFLAITLPHFTFVLRFHQCTISSTNSNIRDFYSPFLGHHPALSSSIHLPQHAIQTHFLTTPTRHGRRRWRSGPFRFPSSVSLLRISSFQTVLSRLQCGF